MADMYDIARLTLDDLERLTATASRLTDGTVSMEKAAQAIVDHLVAETTTDGTPVLLAAHCLTTHDRGRLDPRRARALAARAARGDVPVGHRVVVVLGSNVAGRPMRAEQLAARTIVVDPPSWHGLAPALMAGLGVDANELAEGRPLAVGGGTGVFHQRVVSTGPLWIDPLVPEGTASVVAVGTVLPTGELLTLVLCTAMPVDARITALLGTADSFLQAVFRRFSYRVLAGAV